MISFKKLYLVFVDFELFFSFGIWFLMMWTEWLLVYLAFPWVIRNNMLTFILYTLSPLKFIF